MPARVLDINAVEDTPENRKEIEQLELVRAGEFYAGRTEDNRDYVYRKTDLEEFGKDPIKLSETELLNSPQSPQDFGQLVSYAFTGLDGARAIRKPRDEKNATQAIREGYSLYEVWAKEDSQLIQELRKQK